MGFAQLTARLERETEERVAAIQAEGRKEAEALVRQDAQAQAATYAKALQDLRRERRARLDRELAQARTQARSTILAARRAFVDRVMRAVALQLVDAEKDPQYRVGLVEQTRQALRFADDRATLLRCRPSLVPLLQGLTAGGECVVAQPDPECEVGVLLTARDGSMQIDDTLPSRLRRLAAQLGPHFLAEVEK